MTPPRHLARLCNKPSPLPTFHRAYSLQSQASDCNEMMTTRRAIVGALTFLLAVAATAGAVTFSATNAASSTAGGRRFNRDVGVAYATRVLSDASSFCWKTFSQLSPGGRNVGLKTRRVGPTGRTPGEILLHRPRGERLPPLLCWFNSPPTTNVGLNPTISPVTHWCPLA